MTNKSFEEVLTMLEETVDLLEQGSIGLEESVDMYQKGVELYNECRTRLEKAEQRIKIINTENFEESDIEADIITENQDEF